MANSQIPPGRPDLWPWDFRSSALSSSSEAAGRKAECHVDLDNGGGLGEVCLAAAASIRLCLLAAEPAFAFNLIIAEGYFLSSDGNKVQIGRLNTLVGAGEFKWVGERLFKIRSNY